VNTFLESKRYILFLFVATLMLVVTGCSFAPRESFNAETSRVDMIIYFVPTVTDEQVREFSWEVLSVPTGRTPTEHTLPEGVSGISSCQGPEKYWAYCVEFSSPFDTESRIRLRQEAESWAIVQKVLENVVPMQVTKADILHS
jgi:hypothetical protein